MGNRSLALRAEGNLIEAATLWARAAGGEAWIADGVTCLTAQAPMRSFNQIFLTDLPAQSAIEEAVARYTRAGLRFRLRARASLAEQVEAGLAGMGLRRQGGIPSMTLETAPVPADSGASLDIRAITDSQSLADHAAVVTEAFEWEAGELRRVFTEALLEADGWRGWVVYAEGEAAATCQSLTGGGVTGIYYVGTTRHFRGRGFATAVTLRAIEDGFAQGSDTISLQPSPLGRPIYDRLGFQQVDEFLTFVPEEGA